MLKLSGISKSFSGIPALKAVSLEFKAGEVHALCGENGAGKSTLMNIIVGNLAPDTGTIEWNGEQIEIKSIQQTQNLGISIVYQEKSLVDSLSVAENIFPVNQPRNFAGIIDFKLLYANAQHFLNQLELDYIDPKTPVRRLSAPQKQMIEIAKALAAEPKLLILDEPTASITHTETTILFNIIRRLKIQGISVVYISHRMAEIGKIADTVTILKDGVTQGTFDTANILTGKIISLMVGRELSADRYESQCTSQILFEARNISGRCFENISFNIKKGEILGFAGLLGAGRTEMARAIFGDEKLTGGKIFKQGVELSINHPKIAIENGIAYVPDDRKSLGLFVNQTVSENVVAADQRNTWFNKKQNDLLALKFITGLDIRTPSGKQVVGRLSGGNQQKVVLAKWLSTNPDIIIINEPTNGIDVGAKADIYKLLQKLASEGKGILLISSELPELLLLSDRIAILFNGKLISTIDREEATEEKIAELALGI